jgi:excisionase family DNA binding protein
MPAPQISIDFYASLANSGLLPRWHRRDRCLLAETTCEVCMMNPLDHERFVTPVEAADFLRCSPITVKRLARDGKIPAHPVTNGVRKRWRFLISELEVNMGKGVSSVRSSEPLLNLKGREVA